VVRHKKVGFGFIIRLRYREQFHVVDVMSMATASLVLDFIRSIWRSRKFRMLQGVTVHWPNFARWKLEQ
jgi:hypothetical protein